VSIFPGEIRSRKIRSRQAQRKSLLKYMIAPKGTGQATPLC